MTDLARFEGNIHLGPIDSSGKFLGFLPPVEVDAFTPGREEGETLEIKSKQRDKYQQTIYSEKTAGTTTVAMTLLEQPAFILAIAFAGDNADLTVTPGSVVNEEITVGQLDTIYQLANRNVEITTPPITVENFAETVTYVLDTDYEIVDARVGLIRFLSGGSISVDDVVKVSYNYNAFTGYKILGEAVTEKRFKIFADLKNRITGKDLSMLYHDVKLSAPDVFDLLSSDVISLELEGNAVVPTGETAPYTVVGEL